MFRLGRGLRILAVGAVAVLAVGCGSTDPVDTSEGPPGGTLCFDYFQRCVNPVFTTTLPLDQNNDGFFETVNTCAASGCHLNPGSAGGSLKIDPNAQVVDLSDPLNTPDVVRATTMYGNFLSAKGASDLNTPRQSFLLKKPLVEVLHGGGRVFASENDSSAQQFLYWISNRVPQGANEFSSQCAALFAPGNACQPF
jgi:hypothetical protein